MTKFPGVLAYLGYSTAIVIVATTTYAWTVFNSLGFLILLLGPPSVFIWGITVESCIWFISETAFLLGLYLGYRKSKSGGKLVFGTAMALLWLGFGLLTSLLSV